MESMMGSVSRIWSFVVAAALCNASMFSTALPANAAPAAAPSPEDEQKDLARVAYAAGRQAFNERQFEEAVRQFMRADSIVPKPLLQFLANGSRRARAYGSSPPHRKRLQSKPSR